MPKLNPSQVTRRVYVSMPARHGLPDNLEKLKWAIVDRIKAAGYAPEIFTNPRGDAGLASWRSWTAQDADEVARRCVGAVLIGMRRWSFKGEDGKDVLLPTEYNHYEGAIARTLGLPTLVLIQKNVWRRVVFDGTFGGYVGEFEPSGNEKWVKSKGFEVPFQYWKRRLDDRRDIFLGYCGSSHGTAANLKRYLKELGATVLDWRTDFIAGRSILAQIEEAASLCTAGIFLFTRDDDLVDHGQPDTTAPRDNVVFEAGYFVALKGKRNVLIIREHGSKMPADLGGDIYAALNDRSDIGPIEKSAEAFVKAL